MSDTTTAHSLPAEDSLHGERRRALVSFVAAFVLHAVLIAALALGLGVGGAAAVTPPVTIDLQISSEPGTDALAASAGPQGSPAAPGVSAAPAVSAGPAVPAAPRAVAAPPAAANGADSSGFVIPTPRALPADAAAGAARPAFREAGGSAGAAQSVPSVPSPVPAPRVPPVQQGTGSGTAAAAGAGASSVQRSGSGVLVTGGAKSPSNGSLDLSPLDKTLAGGPTGKAAGKSGGAASGASTGAGSGAAGGSVSGGSAGTGGSGGAGAGQSYSVDWGGADAGKGRTLVSATPPKLPPRVSAQGLTLSVTISFTLLPDGVIGEVSLQQSSGYADVDASVVDAIRRWRFTPAEGAPPARGTIPYVIRVR